MIGKKIAERIGQPDLIDILANELSGTELTSVLLEVFRRKTSQMSPADLLSAYQKNRFAKPADIDPLAIRPLEEQTLQIFRQFGFSPIELSPVAPLGSCSVIAPADQNKILSATRQTEVMADATNALALHTADIRRSAQNQKLSHQQPLRFGTIHRHLRTQTLPDIPGFRAHFKVACFVTSGRDSGNYQFEKEALVQQIAMMTTFFRAIVQIDSIRFLLYPRKGYPNPVGFVTTLGNYLRQQINDVAIDVMTDEMSDNNYYNGLQYKITIAVKGKRIDIGDGGFVNWTQKLLQNKKERLLTGGIGLEFLHRLLHFPNATN